MNVYRAPVAAPPRITYPAAFTCEVASASAGRLFSFLVGLGIVLAAVVVGLGVGFQGTPATSIPSQMTVVQAHAAHGDLYGVN